MKFRVQKSYDTYTWREMGTIDADETGGCVLDGRNGVDNCFWRFTPIFEAQPPAAFDAHAQAMSTLAQTLAQATNQMPTDLGQQQAAGATGDQQEPA